MTNKTYPLLAFIGGGNMARSIIGGLITSGWPPNRIRVSDPCEDQRVHLTKEYDLTCYAENSSCINGVDVIVLAVKPQVLKHAVTSLTATLKTQSPLLVSIVAAISISDTLAWAEKELPFIRVMPNTPSLVKLGAAGLFANALATDEHKKLTETLMQSIGEVVWVEDESLIDTVTGISGSGPAYFFKLMELMIEQGIVRGLSHQSATTLVLQTALGAATLAKQSIHPPQELRNQVTSPSGTTEAGIKQMEKSGIEQAVKDGINAAVDRSAELSAEFGGI